MSVNTFKYIHFAHYKDIPNWSVQYVVEEKLGFTKKYPMAKIGSFLKKSKNLIEIQDDVEYKQVTVKINNGGVIARNDGQLKKGSEIGTKRQTVVHAGQFIVSKIDARNGAFGVIPDDLEGAIVTNDFPVFDVDSSKILPQFMVLISTTPQFVEFARKCSSGTTNRKRIDIDAFLQQVIPLPSLEEQNVLIMAYFDRIKEANTAELDSEKEALKVSEYMYEKLGVEDNNIVHKVDKGRVEFVKFSTITQWGLDFVASSLNAISSSFYSCYKISKLCDISSGGTPNRGCKDFYGGNIPWIKTGELDDSVLQDTEEKITQLGLDMSSAKLYPKGSIVVAMYGATIGKTAKLGVEATTNQACAVLTHFIDNVSPDFVWIYLQTQKENLKKMAYGGAQPNINAGIISEYRIPLPPIKVQNEIVETVFQIQSKARQLKQKGMLLRKKALSDFEQTIFE